MFLLFSCFLQENSVRFIIIRYILENKTFPQKPTQADDNHL